MPGTTPPRNVIYTSWLQADLTAITQAPPALDGPGTQTRTPAAYVTPDGAARVVYLAGTLSNAHIIELRLASDAGSWQQADLTAITQAPPAADVPFGYVTPDGAARVVYPDDNTDVIELYLTSDAGSWQQHSLTAITQAPPDRVGTPFALTGPDGLPRVYYTANGHVIELRLDPGGWTASDLTVSVSNPPAALAQGPPFAYVTPDGALRVIYQDSNGDIIELYLTSDAGSWQQDNLTAITQAPPALGTPCGYVTPDGAARVVYVVGTGDNIGDIIELRLASDAGSWQQDNLTAITQAPRGAVGLPFGYVTPDGAARVVYMAGTGDIIELYLTSDAGSWQQDNLTAITQAPPSTAAAPFAYVTPDGAARVIYQDSNNHIIELRLQPED